MEAWKSLSALTPVWEAAQAGSYEEILRVDDQTRAFMSTLPLFLKMDGYTEFLPQVQKEVEAKPYLLSAKLNINCALQTNILQLHKPYQVSFSFETDRQNFSLCLTFLFLDFSSFVFTRLHLTLIRPTRDRWKLAFLLLVGF